MSEHSDDTGLVGQRVGAFCIEALLGEGGMGEVWRGRHEESQTPVAVKLIHARAAADEVHLDALRREVRALARLNHPGIITIHDSGSLGDPSAPRPYIVMDFASVGNLFDVMDRLDFELVWVWVCEILEALGHAHAGGVIHRDLKPENVLLDRVGDRVVARLTDFGIAHAVDASGRDVLVQAGTPAYMPPEQLLGRWREFGPWTDLYALGCVVWELCAGSPPFEHEAIGRLVRAQLQEPLPVFAPRFAVPEGLAAWLEWLLEKDPLRRPAFAADALEAWRALGEAVVLESAPWPRVEAPRATATTDEATRRVASASIVDRTTLAMFAASREQEPVASEDGDDEVREIPSGALAPWTGRWETRADAGRGAWSQLSSAGQGVYAFRQLPLVGRRRERDVLWQALGAATQRAEAQVVVVRGAVGVGKSRVVQWLTQRAHELGQARVLHLRHVPFGEVSEELASALAHLTRASGATTEEAASHLRRWLGRLGAEAITRGLGPLLLALRPELLDTRGAWLDADPQVIALAAREIMQVLTTDRALVIWCEDADSAELVALARALLGAPGRALLVLEVREEALTEAPEVVEALSALEAAGAQALTIDALGTSAHRQLVRELLGLDDALTERVVSRTQGNPLFAAQLVGDWVERGVLVPGAEGFQLADAQRGALPDELHAFWSERLARIIAREVATPGTPEHQGALEALEIAAALGQRVERAQWVRVCQRAGAQAGGLLLDRLFHHRLATSEHGGFRLAHPMIRESLERRAVEGGRASAHHLACAEALEAMGCGDRPGESERIAHHFQRAGRPERALEPLLRATYQLQIAGHYARAEDALARHDDALVAAGVLPHEPPALRGLTQHLWLDWLRGRLAPGEPLQRAHTLAREAVARQVWDVAGECARLDALVRRFDGDFTGCLAALEVAEGHLSRVSGPAGEEGLARVALSRAVALTELGRADEAEAQLGRVVALAERLGLWILLPRSHNHLGRLAMERDDLALATARFTRALECAEVSGDRKGLAFATMGLGDAALGRGELDEAAQHMARAEALFTSVGSSYAREARWRATLTSALQGRDVADAVARWWRDPRATDSERALAALAGMLCAPDGLAEVYAARWFDAQHALHPAHAVLARALITALGWA